MRFESTGISGAYLVDLEPMHDERGSFARAWCEQEFARQGVDMRLVQGNLSQTHRRGTIRGFHYQLPPHGEAKLVRCIRGAVFDAAIDLRTGSLSYRHWIGVELTGENKRMLLIPAGCAHAYQTLVDDSEVLYFTSQFYTPGVERGVRWDDPQFSVIWPITSDVILSDKDRAWPDYKE